MGHTDKQYKLFSDCFLKSRPNVFVLPVELFKKEILMFRPPPTQRELKFSNAQQPLRSYVL